MSSLFFLQLSYIDNIRNVRKDFYALDDKPNLFRRIIWEKRKWAHSLLYEIILISQRRIWKFSYVLPTPRCLFANFSFKAVTFLKNVFFLTKSTFPGWQKYQQKGNSAGWPDRRKRIYICSKEKPISRQEYNVLEVLKQMFRLFI